MLSVIVKLFKAISRTCEIKVSDETHKFVMLRVEGWRGRRLGPEKIWPNLKTAEDSAHIREDYSELCNISFCCISIYFVIRIVLQMNNRSQLFPLTTLQFLSIDCFNTPTNTSLQRRGAIMVLPCLSSVDNFVLCSYSKAIRCKKRNSSVAHEPPGFPFFFRLIVQRLLCSYSLVI